MNENVQHFDSDPRCSGNSPKLGCILYVLLLLYNAAVYKQLPLAAQQRQQQQQRRVNTTKWVDCAFIM